MISVIVPLYNEKGNVVDLISHLQDIQGIHDVILADASDEDESIDVIARLEPSLPDRFTLVHCNSRGRAVQMNQGAAVARGNILLFLHCDTRLPAQAGSEVDHALESGALWGRFDIRLDARGGIYRLIERMINLRSRSRQLATGDQAIFVNQEAFQSVDGYPEIALMEDVALSQKLKRLSRPALVRTPVFTSARRWQNQGVIKTIFLMWKLRFLYWVGMSPDRLSKLYADER